MRHWIAYIAAITSGVLLAMCFPGFEVSSGFVWVWSLPLMVVLWYGGQKSKKYAFFVGFLSGISFWLLNIKWLLAMGELPTVPLAGATLGWILLSVYLALYFGIWALLLGTVLNPWRQSSLAHGSSIEEKIARKQEGRKQALGKGICLSLRVVGYAFLHASVWVVLEWLRGWLFTGFGWNGLGVAFHEVPVMIQAADLVGVTGVAFVPVFLASVVLQTAFRFYKELKTGKFYAHFEIGITVAIVAFVFAYGINRIAYYSNQPKRAIYFLLIQENTPQSMKWDAEQEVNNYQGYVESTVQALQQLEQNNLDAMRAMMESEEQKVISLEYPDFVMLPESAFTQRAGMMESQEGFMLPYLTVQATKQILEDQSFSLLFGTNIIEIEPDEETNAWRIGDTMYNALVGVNEAFVDDTALFSEHVVAHGKNHLVPFGEYIPEFYVIQKVMELASGNELGTNFSSSHSLEPLTMQVRGEELQLVPTVCFEDTVGRLVRKFVRGQQQVIVNITNDGWFGTSEAAVQHLANAKFRAVENRRPLVRAANTGVSGIVDVVGVMKDKDGLSRCVQDASGNTFVRGTLFAEADVLTRAQMTLYTLLGDWFVLLCGIGALVGIVTLKYKCRHCI